MLQSINLQVGDALMIPDNMRLPLATMILGEKEKQLLKSLHRRPACRIKIAQCRKAGIADWRIKMITKR